MKITRPIALGVLLLLASVAHADTINTSLGTYILPDGSQITSIIPDTSEPFNQTINFTFPGGSGSVFGGSNDGDFVNLSFNSPVYSVSWLTSGFSVPMMIGTTLNTSASIPCTSGGVVGSIYSNLQFCPSGVLNFPSGSTSATVLCYGGDCGIDSFSTDDADPGTFLLLATGLTFVGLVVYRKSRVRNSAV